MVHPRAFALVAWCACAWAAPLPTITLKGASRSFWYSALGPWKDPGAMCEDVFDGELPASAVTTMPTSATAGDRFARVGNHKIQYMCHNGDGLKAVPVWREVITMEEPPVDASPILELQGDNPFIWTIESLPKSKGPGVSKVYFPDPGATCFDPNLGDVDFAVSNLADIEKVGEHSVLYTCTADKNGKMATLRRTVITTDKRPFIKLRGPDLDYSLLDAGGAFEYDDPGAQCFDPDGKEIDGAISIQNQEAKKRHVVGVKYSCMDKEGRSAVPKFRRVVMKRLGKAKPKPVLKLIGKPIDYQPLFQKMYVDLGAKCNDDVDGNDIDYTATMPDLEVPGRHVITYTCTNSRGGTALLRRVVIVGPVPKTMLTVKVVGAKVMHVRLCDDDEFTPSYMPAACIFSDPGFECLEGGKVILDPQEMDVSEPDLSTVGEHIVNYKCKYNNVWSEPAFRVVKVARALPERAPVLTLRGPKIQYHKLCSVQTLCTFRDYGATCTDGDKDISDHIENSVPEVNHIGVMNEVYTCTNDKGVAALPVDRRIVVRAPLPVLKLKGARVQHVAKCEAGESCSFADLGATCTDADGTQINYDTKFPLYADVGTSEVRYTCVNKEGVAATPIYRKVVVYKTDDKAREASAAEKSSSPPTLALIGPKEIHMVKCTHNGCDLNEAGAKCFEADGTDISEQVDVDYPNLESLGVSLIRYTCENTAGLVASPITRKIVVYENKNGARAGQRSARAGTAAAHAMHPAVGHVEDEEGDALVGRQVTWTGLLAQPAAKPLLGGFVLLLAIVAWAVSGDGKVSPRRRGGARLTPDEEDCESSSLVSGEQGGEHRRTTAEALERPQTMRRRSSGK